MNNHPRRMPPSVFDADFRYRPSLQTDIRLTFKRVRRELASASEAGDAFPLNVQPLPLRKEKN